MDRRPEPVDDGVAVERTGLAWTRTALGMLATVIVASRLTATSAPRLALTLILVGGAASAAVLVMSHLRHRSLHRQLALARDESAHVPPAYAALAGLTGTVVVLSLLIAVGAL